MDSMDSMDYDSVSAENSSNSSIYEPANEASQRIIKGKGMSDVAKRRVDKVAVQRCLIENTDLSNLLEHVHCLRRSSKESLLDRLEFVWGMKRFTLNVDTRYNIIILSPKFHVAFDLNEWLLLPETEIIDAYYNARKTRKLPDFDAELYKYTLVAHEDMWGTPIHRQRDPSPDAPSPILAKEDFTYYPHPYRGFPTIVSHVHPRFVICNSGSKLKDNLLPWQKGCETRSDDLAKVQSIWNSWRRVVPTKEFLTKTSDGDDPDTKDEQPEN